MLFAAVDYVCYRREWGRYRTSALEAQGWRRARAANFRGRGEPDIANTIAFHRRFSALSWLVMYATNYPASHVAVYVGNGDIADMLVDGYAKHALSDYFDDVSLMKAYDSVPMTEEERARAATIAQDLVGAARYSRGPTLQKGLRYLFGIQSLDHELVIGRDRQKFVNWRLYGDVCVTFGVVGLSAFPVYITVPALMLYLLFVAMNVRTYLGRIRPSMLNAPSDQMASPPHSRERVLHALQAFDEAYDQETNDLDSEIVLQETVISAMESFLGRTSAIEQRRSLAAMYDAAGRSDDAVDLLKQVLADAKWVHGPNHPLVDQIRADLQRLEREM